jgi:hypothetical protein
LIRGPAGGKRAAGVGVFVQKIILNRPRDLLRYLRSRRTIKKNRGLSVHTRL